MFFWYQLIRVFLDKGLLIVKWVVVYPPPPHHNRFMALFLGPPGWASAKRELLDFMVQGKINRGRHSDHPAGRHSIRTNQCPPPPSPYFYRPDALPATQTTVSKHWRHCCLPSKRQMSQTLGMVDVAHFYVMGHQAHRFSTWPMVTFPAVDHHHSLASIRSYCLVIGACVSERAICPESLLLCFFIIPRLKNVFVIWNVSGWSYAANLGLIYWVLVLHVILILDWEVWKSWKSSNWCRLLTYSSDQNIIKSLQAVTGWCKITDHWPLQVTKGASNVPYADWCSELFHQPILTREFIINSSKISSHFKHVATPPCELFGTFLNNDGQLWHFCATLQILHE